MPKFMPKVPLAQSLLVLSAIFLAAASAIFWAAVPVLSGIFLAVLAVLSAVRFLAPALARFGQQWFAKRAGFNLAFLTGRCIGSASPPAELQR